jgi:hypothetical protein
MAPKTRHARKHPQALKTARKSKFQADLAPAEDQMVRGLKQDLQLSSNTDFLSAALALFRWAVWERKRGHRIFSESETGERKELMFPRLERVAPGVALPRVEISWTPRELESLADLDKPSGTSRKMESVKPSRFRINQESRIPDHKMKSAVYHQTCTFQ